MDLKMAAFSSVVLVTLCLIGVLGDDIDLSQLPKKERYTRDTGFEGFPPGRKVTYPPKIIRDPQHKEIAYKVTGPTTGSTVDPVTLPCVAQGDPQPTNSSRRRYQTEFERLLCQHGCRYEWKKDGEVINFTGRTDIKRESGSGTLIIEEPQADHEGYYQCFASNEHGRAVGVRTLLKKAVLEPFDTVTDAHVHRPEVGTDLTLRCHPPHSYPTGNVYWGQTINGRFTYIPSSNRVALDYDGNLYFGNIVDTDSLNGAHYMCTVRNRVIRGLVQGDDQVIDPQPSSTGGNLYFSNIVSEDARGNVNYACISYNTVLRGLVQGDDQLIQPVVAEATPRYRAPKVMWTSETTTVAIKGQDKKMKCIFSGYPTPDVTWTRVDAELSDHAEAHSSHGLEIIIRNIDFDDEGTYRCSAKNNDASPAVFKEFTLIVESMPFFVTEPENVNTSEEEDAEFICEAGGRPKPSVTWSSNGVPFQDLPEDERRLKSETRIYYNNVTKSDSQVLQCNASNDHGYIFTNVYLNVLAEPPTFTKPPEPVTKRAEMQEATISCRVFGAPKPDITWKLNDTVLTDSRFEIQDSGDLKITNIMLEDRGNYECSAVNKFGKIEANGQLVVRQRTFIDTAPQDQEVNATMDVVFECGATTDPLEAARLEIKWKRDGDEIDFKVQKRLRYNVNDHTLTIIGSEVTDSGEYTCVADNGLDSDEVTAQLTVKDKPDEPTWLRNVLCVTASATITWTAGAANNDEIIEYIVYYNTSYDDPGVFHEATKVPGSETETDVDLAPGVQYQFHVRARNSLGVSDRSHFTSVCNTQPDVPYKHPSGVCVESRDPSSLVIVWEHMEQMDHNGPGFQYVVNFKRLGIPNPTPQVRYVQNWEAEEIVIPDQETFVPYEIYVQASNDLGVARPKTLTKIKGFSGEGVPEVSPSGLRIDEDSLNATSAIFMWDDMDTGPGAMNGLFTGYEIHYWKSDNPDDVHIHEIPVEPGKLCSPLDGGSGGDTRKRRQTDSSANEAHILDLWPNSEISAGILAKNTGNKGELSAPFVFTTPEGVPGQVLMLEVRERGSHHFGVAWAPPMEPNGVILGYDLGHEPADKSTSQQIIPIANPLSRSSKIKDLEADTLYRLYIWAETSKGQGDVYFIEDRTLPAGPPDVPGIAELEVGDDSMNVSWTPSKGNDPNNPGTDFYAEYRKVADGKDAPWVKERPDEEGQNWANVTGLDHGELYEVQIVAVNGRGVESRSEPRKVRIGPQTGKIVDAEPMVQHHAKAGWFIGMMCAIIFLLLLLLIICLIKRNRGGKYPVHEKEKLRGRDPDKEDEEGGFGEYTRTPPGSKVPYMELKSDEPDFKKSAGSLESDKPMGSSDEDSMAEYDQMDPSKFNEDGSFIGQYGGKSKKEEKMDQPDATSPSALSTFV